MNEVERWRRSGLGSAQYARERGLNRSTLLGWSFKIGAGTVRGSETQAHAPVAFLPVRVREQRGSNERVAASHGVIEVGLANGRWVRVAGEVDVSQLARVIAAAEGGVRC